MAIEIMVEKDSSPEEINRAFQAIAFAYRNVVFDYARKKRISVNELAREAGCEYLDVIEQFIRDGSVAPTGKDLDYLIYEINGKREWLSQIKHIQIHASVMHPQPANYSERPPIPKETDLALREALAKTSWFYVSSTQRFLKQNPAG